MKKYPSIAMAIPEILLPHPGIDLSRWAVIACDQHTSEPEYWKKVEAFVADSPSALNLIFPEVYLKEKEPEVRIRRIREMMRRYLEANIFVRYEGLVYVERTVASGKRRGLLLCLDLEQYDYNPGAKTLIRATEGTILERIPPRVKIREGAPLELPHVLVLIDDPEDLVFGAIQKKIRNEDLGLKKLYDFDLMFNSGHVAGWLITDPQIEKSVTEALSKLAAPQYFISRYQLAAETPVLLYAVGDGNHSLATAKTIWERQKKQWAEKKADFDFDSKLRYAMVELVNLHDPALAFEPIHRVVFALRQPTNLIKAMQSYFGNKIRLTPVQSLETIKSKLKELPTNTHGFGLLSETQTLLVEIFEPTSNLTVGTLQAFLDEFLKRGEAEGIDYVHGEEAVLTLGRQPGNSGFYLPAMDKSRLFRTVIQEGVLPRKTFSLGEAWEKRFYLEARPLS